jgi:hypothetical protein
MLSIALVSCLYACEQPGDPYRGTQGPSGGSAEETSPAALVTDATTYRPDQSVTVRLVNRSRSSLVYNLCRASLERHVDDNDWRPARLTLGDVCTAELRTLRPGQSASYSFRFDREHRRGEYRVRMNDQSGAQRWTVVSNGFRLQGDQSD